MIPINTNATTVRVYAGVPLTLGGEDKYYFASASALQTALGAYQVWEGNNFSYQRIKYSVPEGKASYTIILPVSVAGLNAGCVNYLSITQNGLTTYCFITDCEMEGSDSSHIEYTPDYFTTFINRTTLSGYVEREHSATDNPGGNVVPEPINPANFTIVRTKGLPNPLPTITSNPAGVGYLILASEPTSLISTIISVPGMKSSGTFGGEVLSMDYYFTPNAADAASKLVEIQKVYGSNGVYGVYMTDFSIEQQSTVPYNSTENFNNYDATYSSGIKNKKLLTSQFYYHSIWSRDGEQVMLKPELYGETITIEGMSTAGANAVTSWHILSPYAQYPGYSVGVSAKRALPMLYSQNDSAYTVLRSIAGGFINFGQQVFNSALEVGSTYAQRNYTANAQKAAKRGAIGGVAEAIESYGAIGFDALRAWNQNPVGMAGNSPGGYSKMFLTLGGVATFGLPEDIKTSVDDYFSAYGYQTNAAKNNISFNSRPSWNYIKMGNAVIKGIMPDMARETILDYFKSGVRLWHVSDIGNYTLANEV